MYNSHDFNDMKAKPFLKWAGGKTQLLSQFEQFYPHELRQQQLHTYVEPFIGSGAVFFEIMQKQRCKKCASKLCRFLQHPLIKDVCQMDYLNSRVKKFSEKMNH